jgi:L-amino acid N-acyltransferase YncA
VYGRTLTPQDHRRNPRLVSLSQSFVPASSSSPQIVEDHTSQPKDPNTATFQPSLRTDEEVNRPSSRTNTVSPQEVAAARLGIGFSHHQGLPRPAGNSRLRLEAGPPVTDDYFPDLTLHGAPRRNHDYSESSPSMPSDISSFQISDTGIENDAPSDVRNDIAPKNLLLAHGDKWGKNIWAEEEDDTLQSQSYLEAFIKAWVVGTSNDIKPDFLEQDVPQHWLCDIDTATGHLIQPVDFPDSYMDPGSAGSQLTWKRRNWSSELLSRRHLMSKKNKNNKYGPPGAPTGWFDTADLATPLEFNHGNATGTKVEPVPVLEPEPEPEIVHPDVPKIPCYMRPASADDMEGVSQIYKWEVLHGTQALDSVPLSAADFENILHKTRSHKMPFVVMVMTSGEPTGNGLEKKENIIGFGFLSIWQPGLAGHCDGTSRLSAKVNIFVHPEFRKKKIGFSLLDKLMSVSSENFSSKDGYDFVDYDQDPAYDSFRPHRKIKPFFKLYIQYFVRSKPAKKAKDSWTQEALAYDADLKWLETFLGHPFNFEGPSNRMGCSHRTKKEDQNQEYFLDSVIFEHDCNSRSRYPELQD